MSDVTTQEEPRRPRTILPGLRESRRIRKDGTTYYEVEILAFGGDGKVVLATVYGDTLDELRARKWAVARAMKELEAREVQP